ncbi:MAG: ATP-grasp domain-containing protein [Desulforhabdus sp.]|jgi:ribosomal protein S6--L-glutamate ligase|nr:ATP-grasp domain-containing protein [Desulforhabdus sp.]
MPRFPGESEENMKVSLGKRLRTSPSFDCIGTYPNWNDYSATSREAIRRAKEIYYPSAVYEDLFQSIGKRVFPSNFYRLMGNKIRQSALFKLRGVPHPRTRLYYGRRRLWRILQDFDLPLIAKTPVGSSQGSGVWLIQKEKELTAYLKKHHPAYIQRYLPIDRDLRVVVIAGRVVHSYWRIQKSGDFRNNVSQGARISYLDIPHSALEFAVDVAKRCNFGEVGLDICLFEQEYFVIEANMVYGLEGFRQAGLDIYEILADLDVKGLL